MNVFLADEQAEPVDPEPLRLLAADVLEAEGMPAGTEVAIVLVGEGAMTEYNQRFMERPGATDVLAFPLQEMVPGTVPAVAPNEPPLNLGDVFICPSVVRSNASVSGASFADEMRLMIVHGILHLLGYDHGDDAEADAMEERERRLLGGVRP